MALPISVPTVDLSATIHHLPGPLYRRVAAALKDAIEAGAFPPGSRLPPERQLASELGVSRVTVVAAYAAMRDDGLVERRRGSGTRVVKLPPAADPWIGLGVGQLAGYGPAPGEFLEHDPDAVQFSIAALPGHSAVVRAARAALENDLESMLEGFGYSPSGLAALRTGLARRHSAEGLPTSAEQILVTTGAQQAISLLCMLLVGPERVAVVEDPTYAGALDALRAVGARPLGVPVDAAGAQTDTIEQLVRRTAPSLIYMVPIHQNPTGVNLADQRRRQLVDLVARTRTPLVDDRSLAGLGWGDESVSPPPLATLDLQAPVITVGSLSKLTWGGLRVGWIRASETLIDRLTRLKLAVDHGGSILSQAAAVQLLPDLDLLTEARRRQAAAGFEVLSEALTDQLPDWRLTRPTGGLSAWVRIPYGSAAGLAEVAQRHGAIIIPGPVFSPTGQHGDRLRLTFGHQPEVLRDGIRRLASAWRQYAPSANKERPRIVV